MLSESQFSNYERWTLILEKSSEAESKTRLENCYKFLKHFPFSFKVWGNYSHLMHSVQGKKASVLAYREAIRILPKQMKLHLSFCLYVEDAYQTEPDFVIRTYAESFEALKKNFDNFKFLTFYIRYLSNVRRVRLCHGLFWDLLEVNVSEVREIVSQ